MYKLIFIKTQLYLQLMVSFISITSTNNETSSGSFPWENREPIGDFTEADLRESIQTFLAEDIVTNTTKKLCVRIPNPGEFNLCIKQPFSITTINVRDLLIACSIRNYTILKQFLDTHQDLDKIDLVIFSKCLDTLFEVVVTENYDDFINIIKLLIIPTFFERVSLVNHFLSKYLSYIKDKDITKIDRQFIFKVWNPFDNNVSGFSTNRNFNYTEFESINQHNQTDVELAIYIPFNFLNDANRTLSAAEKIKFRVAIFLVMESSRSSHPLVENRGARLLMIDIPRMCADNGFPLIGIVMNGDRKELKLGDFDPYSCASFFCENQDMQIVNFNDIFPTAHTCSKPTASNNYSRVIWSHTPVMENQLFFPENLCINDNFATPVVLCKNAKITYFNLFNETICLEEISSSTRKIYQLMKCCLFPSRNCQLNGININAVQHYIDVNLLFVIYKKNLRFKNTAELVDKGLEYLRFEDPLICTPVQKCLASLFHWLLYSTLGPNSIQNLEQKNFVMQIHTYDPFSPFDFKLYKNRDLNRTGNDYKMQVHESDDYLSDVNTEAVVRISKESSVHNKFGIVVGFIIPSSDITRNMPLICRSKIVMLFYSNRNAAPLNFTFYLKTIDESVTFNIFGNVEYWFNLQIESGCIYLICVSESRGNVCNNDKSVSIYKVYVGGHLTSIDSPNVTVMPLGLLSQLATSVNPNSKQAYLEHSSIFKIITYIGSALSLIGISCILLSAIFLKDWFTERFNTTQLSIVLAFEIIFLLTDHNIINHIAYLIFFYCLLAQFAWMLLISYQQYRKFIKVFDFARLNMTKSLILGWLSPALIILIPSVLYKDCFECDLCYRNRDIFNYFVVIPICCVMIINLVVYIGVVYNISKDKCASERSPTSVKRAKIMASIVLPFFMGLSWFSIFTLFVPSLWISLGGSYIFHIVTTSQGFVLFIFTVCLDEKTKKQWRMKWERLYKKGSSCRE